MLNFEDKCTEFVLHQRCFQLLVVFNLTLHPHILDFMLEFSPISSNISPSFIPPPLSPPVFACRQATELPHLFTISGSNVLHHHRDAKIATNGHLVSTHYQIMVLEGGV